MEIACNNMNKFEIIQPLATHPRFTIFEAYAKKLQFLVVMKQCEYSNDSEAEFFIRSALMKTKNKVYMQPLLSIFADVEPTTKKEFIALVWKKGDTLDIEVEQDIPSEFPSGEVGYGKSKPIAMNTTTKEVVEKVHCLTLGRKVARKVSKKLHMIDLSSTFKEALAHAKCTHPNICEFLDFRLFQNSKGMHFAYIVMEKLQLDLNSEIEERKSQPYEETELREILKDVTAGLLHAKSLNIAHRDIKPANILRGPRGLKIVDFGSTWLKGMTSHTDSVAGTDVYISPEALDVMGNFDLLHRPFESDVFSLGMTMLHLASLRLPPRMRGMSNRELEALVEREVQELKYNGEFKELLRTMLSIAPHERPALESIAEFCAPPSKEQADSLREQGDSKRYDGDYSKAIKMYEAAQTIYSRLPNDKDTARNLRNWGAALRGMGRNKEAVAKYQEAQTIYSRFPNDKDTARNLMNLGAALGDMRRTEEEVAKYQEAHIIYSRFSKDKDTARNLANWGAALRDMGRNEEAVAKYQEAQTIYSRFPNDKDTARNLTNLGAALGDMGSSEEEIAKYQEAHIIYSRLPNDKDTARNLRNWGAVLRNMGRNEEAVTKYQEAQTIYSRFPNDKDTARNLTDLGAALGDMGRGEEEVAKYQEAQAIYSRFLKDKDTARNLRNWGAALRDMGRNEEAVAKYQEAQTIYSRFPNDKDTARNLTDLGVALGGMGRTEEAVAKYQEAQTIYSRLPKGKDTARNFRNWGAALGDMGRKKRAVEKLQEALKIYFSLGQISFANGCKRMISTLGK